MKDRFKVVIESRARGELQFPLVEGELTVTWTRDGAPGKLVCNIVKDKDLDYQEGDTLAFYVDDALFFYGYVFSKSRDGNQIIKTTCYDQIRYLKNKSTLQYEGWTYSALVKNICKQRGLPIGEIEDTKVAIPARIEQDKEFYEMLKYASEYTTAYSGNIFVLYDKAGKICLKNIVNMKCKDLIDYDCTQDFDYQTEINEACYNRVRLTLVDDEKREVKSATAEDTKHIKAWGLLTYSATTNDEEVDLGKKAKEMLSYLSRKNRKLKLKDIVGRVDVRAGSLVPVVMMGIGDIDIHGYMLVASVTHKFQEEHHFMDLEVMNKDINGQVGPEKLPQKQKQQQGGFDGVGGTGGTSKAIEIGKTKIGSRYKWGHAGPNTFDCSGFVSWCAIQAGLMPPGSRITSGNMNPRYVHKVSWSEIRPGDIVHFSGSPGHVAYYIGDGKVLECGGTTSMRGNLGYSGVGITSLNGRRHKFKNVYRFNKS